MDFTEDALWRMNGGGWINMDATKAKHSSSPTYKLYPTGTCTITYGREYVAVPSDKILTASEKKRLNIM